MQNKTDSMNDTKVWAISFRQLDTFNDVVKESIEIDSSAVRTVQRMQNLNSSTLPVQQDDGPLEHNVPQVSRPIVEERLRKWLVCLSAFVVMVIDVGFLHAFGILFIDIMEEFQTTRASAAVIQSVLIGVALGTGIFCGALVTRFGPRKVGLAGGILVPTGLILSYFASGILMLDITLGVISGLGVCFIYISNTTAIGLNFNGPSKVLALSLMSTGSGVGGLSYPFLLRHLREKYGLQETFLIVGGLALNTIPCAMLWGAPADKDVKNFGESEKTKKQSKMEQESSEEKQHESLQLIATLFRNVPYILFVLGNMCTLPPLTMFTVLITDIYDQKSFGKSNSTVGISIMNIFSFFGRLAPGLLKQIPKFSALYTPIACSILGATLIMSVNFTVSLAATLIVSGLLGFSFGVFISTLTVTTVSLVGPELFPSAVGVMFTLNGVINLAIGPLSGLVKDVTQSYEFVLYGATALMVCGCASFCSAFLIRRKRQQENR